MKVCLLEAANSLSDLNKTVILAAKQASRETGVKKDRLEFIVMSTGGVNVMCVNGSICAFRIWLGPSTSSRSIAMARHFNWKSQTARCSFRMHWGSWPPGGIVPIALIIWLNSSA